MKRALQLSAVAFCFLFLVTQELRAVGIVATWTGQVDSVVDPDGDFAGQVNVGDSFSLSYCFDPSGITDLLPADSTIGIYHFSSDVEMTFGTINLSPDAIFVRLEVRDNWNGVEDSYSLNSLAPITEQGLTDAVFFACLDDPSLTNGLVGDAMYQPGINVADFDVHSFEIVEESGVADESRVEGTLLNLTLVSLADGDFDMDGDVDLSDFAQFSLCFGGANTPPAASCPPGVDADFDDDGDVDLGDFATFSLNFTGPL